MCSSACERAGSAQIAVSTVVAALAQSKLAAWAPHAGTARQAPRRRAARMARGWRVRGGAATDSTGMAERMCRLPTPGRQAGTPHTLVDDRAGRTLPQDRVHSGWARATVAVMN